MLGVFTLNRLGIEGGTLQMINHGLSTGGLFACVGMLYERYHTREIRDVGGVARSMPLLATFVVIFALSSIGLPGLNGFAGEFLVLLGMFQRSWTDAPAEWADHYRLLSVVAVSGVILGAWYMLWLVQRTFFGPLKEPEPHDGAAPIADLSAREVFALAPLVVLIVWIGVRPGTFLAPIRSTVDRIVDRAEAAYEESYARTGLRP
jgi:NADH-quinone oxidoreductase subunit M